ncbi:MAG TPA: TIGR03435 family protein, partial [Desulfuromonadaceae bacterium]|nr:TIGR03435 family protein [Desulfuromonadaceae bacterium]
LAKSATTVALAKGATASASTLTLIKGALKFMTWTKVNITVATGAAALLIIGSAAVALFEFAPVSVESAFQHCSSNHYLKRVPPTILLRRTLYFTDIKNAPASAGVYIPHAQYVEDGSFYNESENRFIGRNRPMDWVLAIAYDTSPGQMVLPPDLPMGQFDYLSTMTSNSRMALGNEIRKQFGLAGHVETIQTNVLVLKSADPAGRRALKVSRRTSDNNMIAANPGNLTLTHFKISDMAKALSGYYLGAPVVDETGLTDFYDVELRWDRGLNGRDRVEAIKQALAQQLGLELVPDQRAVEMLIVAYQDSPTDYTPRAGSDLQGYWKGTEKWGTNLWPVIVKITEPSEGQFRAQFRNRWFNPQFVNASSVTYDPPHVKIDLGKHWAVFEGDLNSSHTEIKGIFNYVVYSSGKFPMTIRLADPNEEAALEAQKDYSYTAPGDLTGHWTATLSNVQWTLDIGRMPDGTLSCALTPPGWNDRIENSLLRNTSPEVYIEWGYRRTATFHGTNQDGKLVGTLQQDRKGVPQPVTFMRVER